jgi:hypothetical protein
MKGRKNRVPPPPPRDMAFVPSTARSRAVSGGMMEQGLGMGVGGIHRENSFATRKLPPTQSVFPLMP